MRSSAPRPAQLAALLFCHLPAVVLAADESAAAAASIEERLQALSAELDSLRQDNEALRKHLGSLQSKADQPPAAAAGPLSTLKVGGELRMRYENFGSDNDAFVERNRLRGRLRIGGTAAISGNLEAGLRLTTGTSEGEPTGNNFTWQDNASKKAIAVDLAYLKWTTLRTSNDSLALTLGKMSNPLASSDLVFDSDYTPEGLALQYNHNFGPTHALRANTAAFVIDELSASQDDPLLYARQLRWDAAWTPRTGTSFGITSMDLSNGSLLTNGAVPDVHKGNTRTAAGALVNTYRPWVVDVSITQLLRGIPVRLAGDYMENQGADTDNNAYYGGLFVGKAGTRRTWELSYRYRVAESDAWYEELIDSDSGAFYAVAPPGGAAGYAGGTNVRGHILAGNYALTDNSLVGFTYFSMRLIEPSPTGSESRMGRLQVNAIVRF